MALSDPLPITYDGLVRNLVRMDPSASGPEYTLEVSPTLRLNFSIRHTIPARGQFGESHLVRLDAEHADVDGNLLRNAAAWMVIKTFDGRQDAEASADVANALTSFLDATMVDRVISREG